MTESSVAGSDTMFKLLEWTHASFGTDRVFSNQLTDKAVELGMIESSSNSKGRSMSLGHTLRKVVGRQHGTYVLEEANTNSAQRGYRVVMANNITPVNTIKTKDSDGLFYIAQLFPNHAPHLIKFGYTDRSVDKRLSDASYSTLAPTVKEIGSYRCYASLEDTVTKLITKAIECEQVGGEVYSVRDIGALLRRAKEVLNLLNGER